MRLRDRVALVRVLAGVVIWTIFVVAVVDFAGLEGNGVFLRRQWLGLFNLQDFMTKFCDVNSSVGENIVIRYPPPRVKMSALMVRPCIDITWVEPWVRCNESECFRPQNSRGRYVLALLRIPSILKCEVVWQFIGHKLIAGVTTHQFGWGRTGIIQPVVQNRVGLTCRNDKLLLIWRGQYESSLDGLQCFSPNIGSTLGSIGRLFIGAPLPESDSRIGEHNKQRGHCNPKLYVFPGILLILASVVLLHKVWMDCGLDLSVHMNVLRFVAQFVASYGMFVSGGLLLLFAFGFMSA